MSYVLKQNKAESWTITQFIPLGWKKNQFIQIRIKLIPIYGVNFQVFSEIILGIFILLLTFSVVCPND